MAALNPRLADLSHDDRQLVESWLVEFDERWDEGRLANRLDQIPPGSSWRLPALAEMVKIDLMRQWQRGRQVSLESYLEQFPELGSPGDVSADLIQAEYEVRRQFGAAASPEEYLRRFPHQAGELARLFARGGSALSRQSSVASPSRSSSSWIQKRKGNTEQLPEEFGRYRIIKRLGQGGMGSVYLAQDTHLERPVALKVPHFGSHEGPEARRRFLEEARTAATLDHPYLCPVYDAGEIDGQLYLTMAYIEGKSLAALIGTEGWPQRQVAALVGKLALALQDAHKQKVVHRDLKPANIMIKTTGPRREPVIVDFGLARRDNPQDQRLTRSGQVMGTLGYMAPEQIRADLNQIGSACDIYALGVILYELLTGRLPFSGSGLAIAGEILTQVPLPPSKYRSDLDPTLEAICLKAMARTIADRYTSMAELAAALTGFLQSPSAIPTFAAPAGSPASGERPRPAGSNSLVGQLLARLAGTEASPSPIPTPKPVASTVALLARRRLVWPMIAAASVLGVISLSAVIYVATDTARTRNNAENTGVIPIKKDAATGSEMPTTRAGGLTVSNDGSDEPAVAKQTGGQAKQAVVRGLVPPVNDTDTGGAGSVRSETQGDNVDPSRYIDIQLITSCSGPRGEVYDGAWWAVAGPKSTINPPVPMSSGGYLDTAAHVTGTRSLSVGDFAKFGINMRRGQFGLFDASGYQGISFYAKADKPMEIEVGMGQENTDPAYGLCAAMKTCYNSPKLAVTIGTVWSRFVVPFDALVSDPVPGGGRVPVTPATITHFAFTMPVGVFGFWVDEIYFVRGVEKVPGAVLGSAGSTEPKPPVPTSVAAGSPAPNQGELPAPLAANAAGSTTRSNSDKERVPRAAPSRDRALATGPPKLIANSIGIKLRLIPAGIFLMGSTDEDKDAKGDETPRHSVRITRPFYLGATEVTVGQFRRFVDDTGYQTEAQKDGKGGLGWNDETKKFGQNARYTWQNPGFKQTDEHPVVNVSWNDAVAFTRWLSGKEGKSYRLPTEAEWEYACRAGTQTRFSNGDQLRGVVEVGNAKDRTATEKQPSWGTTIAARDGYVYSAPVGRFQPNSFGSYDMHGNAEEWCSDGYDADYYHQSPVDDPPGASRVSDKVIRGGAWYNIPANTRSAGRWHWPPDARVNWLGFRVALVSAGP
jgi:formylglycine-generating enzyme required for sulfatase activity/serine/threonine protein kinase